MCASRTNGSRATSPARPSARATSWTRVITAFITSVDQAAGLDPELKRVLIVAREALASGDLTGPDKDDAADDLGKLTGELTKPEPQPSRVKRLFDGIKHLARRRRNLSCPRRRSSAS